ncbi:MAG: hypothetical protein KKE62_01625 [Proteobacteria bacterium]|nr:hypothetical protein [Pseudomonadota bacterium]MBU1387163.1 hypothetical protein [Pseudomonadota bacterium]MBU1541520.1 hypothetical protein [Pseudomonadota bacterium]MBU2480913.1 hypothetical protein [Pseudomonadota bacterium]
MNDFLQSLRSGALQSQRPGMTRKAYDHTYHSANQQYQYYNNTPPETGSQSAYPAGPYVSNGQDDASTSLLLLAIETLSRQIGKLAENQTQLVATQEKTADIIERQTLAIEKIINHLELSSRK